MQCGPGTVMQPGPHAPLLRCPRCGSCQPLPAVALFVVTGPVAPAKACRRQA
jgi:hypothetical protein